MYYQVYHFVVKYLGEPIGIAEVNPNLQWTIKGWRLSEYHPENFQLMKINKAEYETHIAFETFPILKIRYPESTADGTVVGIIGLMTIGVLFSLLMLAIS